MAEKKGIVKEIATGMPPWAKGVVAVGLLAGGGYLIYYLIKNLKEGLKSLQDLKEKKQLQSDKEELINSGMKPTYQQTQYNKYADSLWSCLGGATEDEDCIRDVMRAMKNDVDVLTLIEAYGTRDIGFWSTKNLDLVSAIREYLYSSEVETYVNLPLRNNKVKYQF